MGVNPNALPEYRPRHPETRSKWVTWVWVGILLLLVFACVFVIVIMTNGARIGCILTNCRHNPTGPAASWAEQYAAAQEAALKVDPDAVLDHLSVETVADWPKDWTISNTLKITFNYIRPSGRTLTVDLQDSAPASTVDAQTASYVSEYDKDRYEELIEMREQRAQKLALVKIGPREAEQATWQEAADEAKRDGVDIAPSFDLSYEYMADGQSPAWNVTYWPIPTDNPPSLFSRLGRILSNQYSSTFTVDAVTGEVLTRELGPNLE